MGGNKGIRDDLISRKALRDELCKYRKQFLIGSLENIIVSAAIGFVNSAQTAFDKEKVIEELHTERNPIYREDGSLMSVKTYISIDNAIEIVEKGGIE